MYTTTLYCLSRASNFAWDPGSTATTEFYESGYSNCDMKHVLNGLRCTNISLKTSSSSSTGKKLGCLSNVCGMKGTSEYSLAMVRGDVVLCTPGNANYCSNAKLP